MVEQATWIPAYSGRGSNLENPAQQVQTALGKLQALPVSRVVAESPLYANPPMGPQDQPEYVNAVAGILTQLPPEQLLSELQALESALGRVRTPGDRWGPRVIDLDLLVYGTLKQSLPGLDLPHSGISERNFVLFPLCDIAPRLTVPGAGVVATLARDVGDDGLQRINS